jgi:FixJ family two-component response regulator
MFRAMVAHRSHISIVDDDPAMRQAVGRLCGAAHIPNRCFASAEDFLTSEAVDSSSCLILDIQLPGLSGFELHEQLRERGIHLPVVFMTGQDLPLNREKALKAGGTYLTKPFPSTDLIAAVRGHIQDESPSTNTQPPQTP